MQKRDLQTSIYNSWELIEQLGLAETFATPVPLEVNLQFRDSALDPSLKYRDLYEIGLNLSYYNFLLSDYSYFQFSISEADCVRYAYYPNPYLSGDVEALSRLKGWRELSYAGMIAHEDMMALLKGTEVPGAIPLIRYENAPSQHRGLKHPCSHFHLGHHSENRWPLRRVLTGKAFTLLISKMYYPQRWSLFDDDDIDCKNSLDRILIAEKANCRIISDDLFTAIEASSFHFY